MFKKVPRDVSHLIKFTEPFSQLTKATKRIKTLTTAQTLVQHLLPLGQPVKIGVVNQHTLGR